MKDYPSLMATGDVNGDGRSDLVVALDRNLAVMLAKPDGTFETPAGP